MIHWEFSHIPFDGELTDDKIVCQNCGWSWDVKDGGNDLYMCHKCNTDNSKFYNYSNFVDAGAIAGAVGSVAGAVGSVAQAKANKEVSKSSTLKEIEARCGKDKSKSWSKKKKNAFISCRDSVLKEFNEDKKLARSDKQKTQELQQKQQQELLQANREKQKNQTYIVIGIIAVILGFVVYKKMNK